MPYLVASMYPRTNGTSKKLMAIFAPFIRKEPKMFL